VEGLTAGSSPLVLSISNTATHLEFRQTVRAGCDLRKTAPLVGTYGIPVRMNSTMRQFSRLVRFPSSCLQPCTCHGQRRVGRTGGCLAFQGTHLYPSRTQPKSCLSASVVECPWRDSEPAPKSCPDGALSRSGSADAWTMLGEYTRYVHTASGSDVGLPVAVAYLQSGFCLGTGNETQNSVRRHVRWQQNSSN
jgi:hypothetical protein